MLRIPFFTFLYIEFDSTFSPISASEFYGWFFGSKMKHQLRGSAAAAAAAAAAPYTRARINEDPS